MTLNLICLSQEVPHIWLDMHLGLTGMQTVGLQGESPTFDPLSFSPSFVQQSPSFLAS